MKVNQYVFIFLVSLISLLSLLYLPLSYAAEPTPVGKISYIRGAVSAKSNVGGQRLLNKNSPVYTGDSIVTGNTSFVIVALKDGTKMTIRPQSIFVINQYQFSQSKDDKADFYLLKGGVRTVTGSINQNNPKKMSLTTPTTTMGIQESDFVARLCDGSCTKKSSNKKSSTVARVALAKGGVYIENKKGKQLAKTGTRLNVSDTVSTDEKGFVVLVFDDNTRVTIQPKTALKIAEYIFQKGQPQQGKVSLSLAKGSARTLTGIIGKANPTQFKLKTPVATLGIRGTGFDTYYGNKDGALVSVWQGSIIAFQGGKSQDIGLNEIFQINNNRFNQLQQLPQNIFSSFDVTLRPDNVNTQSTWVSVKSGKVILQENTADSDNTEAIELSSGETALANQATTNKEGDIPDFIADDPYTNVSPIDIEDNTDVFGNPDSNNQNCTID